MNQVIERAQGQEVFAPDAGQDTASLLAVITRGASDPAIDVTKLERIMALYERIEGKKAEQAFSGAMIAAQEEMDPVRTDATNPQTRSKYATWAALDRAIRPIYSKHGFALSFDTGDGAPADYVRVLLYVMHKAGHTKTYHMDMPADGKGAKGNDVMTKTHATGSAFTYGKRYVGGGAFNIIVSDDDGNAASSKGSFVTEEQAERLLELLTKDKADVQRFCTYMKVPNLTEILASDYERAITVINTRSQKVKEKAQ